MQSKHFLLFCISIFSLDALFSQNIYVSANAQGNSTGETWSDAYSDLQQAIKNSSPSDTIHISEGIYYPTADTNREESFEVKHNLVLIGGYSSLPPHNRNLKKYNTILSGNIGNREDKEDNSYSIIQIMTEASKVKIDGLYIQEGFTGEESDLSIPLVNPSKSGAGIYIFTNSAANNTLEVVNSVFRDNRALPYGGAIFLRNSGNNYSKIILDSCKFERNSGLIGGCIALIGAENSNQELKINNSHFSSNRGLSQGGVIYRSVIANGTSKVELVNSIFRENRSTVGGIMDSYIESNTDSIIIENCDFTENFGTRQGGIIRQYSSGSNKDLVINNSVFQKTNDVFTDDYSVDGTGGVFLIENENFIPSKLYINNCLFQDNQGKSGTIIFSNNYNQEIYNTVFSKNDALKSGGIFFVSL
ncbi:MAG: hypothetical protein AAGG68_19960 [Bacteroidota bacterium]